MQRSCTQLGTMSEDPIGFGDGPNIYVYVGSDPINFTDPTGLTAETPLSTLSISTSNPGFNGPTINELIFGGLASTPVSIPTIPSLSSIDTSSNFTGLSFPPNQGFSNFLDQRDRQNSLAFSQSLVTADLNGIAQFQQAAARTREFDAIVGGTGSGLVTGGKAISNSFADTASNLVTLGFSDSPVRFTPTNTDIANGFGAASFSSRAGFEIATGLITGAVSKLGKVGKALFALDIGGNTVSTGHCQQWRIV